MNPRGSMDSSEKLAVLGRIVAEDGSIDVVLGGDRVDDRRLARFQQILEVVSHPFEFSLGDLALEHRVLDVNQESTEVVEEESCPIGLHVVDGDHVHHGYHHRSKGS